MTSLGPATLPLSWARESGLSPGVLNQLTIPVKFGATPSFGRVAICTVVAAFLANWFAFSPLIDCSCLATDPLLSM